MEYNNSISFLDVKINIKIKYNLTYYLSTLTYYKPIFTGVMLNWNSLTSIKHKKGLIGFLLDRSLSKELMLNRRTDNYWNERIENISLER